MRIGGTRKVGIGGYRSGIGADGKIGCMLDIAFRKIGVADQGYFMSHDVHGHRCQNIGGTWALLGRKLNGSSDYVNCGNAIGFYQIPFSVAACVALQAKNDHWLIGKDDNALGRAIAFGTENGTGRSLVLQIGGNQVDHYAGARIDNGMVRSAVASFDLDKTRFSVDGDMVKAFVETQDVGAGVTAEVDVGRRSYGGYEGYTLGIVLSARIHSHVEYAAKVLQRAIQAR